MSTSHTPTVAEATLLLEKAKSLRFKTSFLAQRLAEGVELDQDFGRYLLALSMAKAERYDAMMAAHNGDPRGVEFKRSDRDSWAFILPDVGSDEGWRVQYFDQSSFSSHSVEKTLEQAAESLCDQHFDIEDAGALDRVSATLEWERGGRVCALMQAHASGQITYRECLERCGAVNAEYKHMRKAA